MSDSSNPVRHLFLLVSKIDHIPLLEANSQTHNAASSYAIRGSEVFPRAFIQSGTANGLGYFDYVIFNLIDSNTFTNLL